VSSREIHGQELTLSASGWVYDNRFVLYDYETESIWYCLGGDCRFTCVSGVHRDKSLLAFPSVKTAWHAWKSQHPASLILHDTQVPAPVKVAPSPPAITREWRR
jgi:hypothetical protein